MNDSYYVVDYRVVDAANLPDLVALVNQYILQGWEPQGGVSHSLNFFANLQTQRWDGTAVVLQAMVKREPRP